MEQDEIISLQNKAKKSIEDFDTIAKELESATLSNKKAKKALEELVEYTASVKDVNVKLTDFLKELSQFDLGQIERIENAVAELAKTMEIIMEDTSYCKATLLRLVQGKPRWFR